MMNSSLVRHENMLAELKVATLSPPMLEFPKER